MSEVDPRLLAMLVCPLTKTRLIYNKETKELISDVADLATDLHATLGTGPNKGDLQLNGDGGFTYEPDENTGAGTTSYEVSFTYQVCDEGVDHNGTDPACTNGTVTLNVLPDPCRLPVS